MRLNSLRLTAALFIGGLSTVATANVIQPTLEDRLTYDVPMDAIGAVDLEISLSEEGRVSKCTAFGDDPKLELASCEIVLDRFVVRPKNVVKDATAELIVEWRDSSVPQATVYAGATPLDVNKWIDWQEIKFPRSIYGTTWVVFDINMFGEVADCQVVSSSGNARLDKFTCTSIKNHARFLPALDQSGQFVETQGCTALHWRVGKKPDAQLGSEPKTTCNDFLPAVGTDEAAE